MWGWFGQMVEMALKENIVDSGRKNYFEIHLQLKKCGSRDGPHYGVSKKQVNNTL